MEKEIFDGKIIVYSDGRLWSKTRNRFLHPSICRGYEVVTINNKSYRVHRLVATAFLPNPNNLPQVNHKDENKTNNHVDNLEWCDSAYNNRYGTKPNRISNALRGKPKGPMPDERKIRISDTLKGRPSPNKGKKASEETRRKQSEAHRNISDETRQKMSDTNRRINSYLRLKDSVERKKRKVMQYTRDGELVEIWDSIEEAARCLDLKSPNIIACCNNRQKTCGKYVWKYA